MSRSNIGSADMPQLSRRLSLEENFSIADRARRKSSDRYIREDLRLKLGHTNVLDAALKGIAALSPPPSPTQSTCTPLREPTSITWATQIVVSHAEEGDSDDYGFSYDDDGEEDISGLTLSRTPSKPKR